MTKVLYGFLFSLTMASGFMGGNAMANRGGVKVIGSGDGWNERAVLADCLESDRVETICFSGESTCIISGCPQ